MRAEVADETESNKAPRAAKADARRASGAAADRRRDRGGAGLAPRRAAARGARLGHAVHRRGSDGGRKKTETQTARININTASAVELQTLPGIGEVLSARIVDYREEHGAFAQIEDIKNVYGIGDGIFSNIQARITVGAATVRAEEDDDR